MMALMMFSLPALHIVNNHNSDIVFGCDLLKAHQPKSNCSFALLVAVVVAFQVFAKGVNDDYFQLRELQDYLFKHIME